MNEHQERLWQRMIDVIQDYIDGKSDDFFGTVGALEGALDASEIESADLVNRWYGYWFPLEMHRAEKGNNVDRQEAVCELEDMKDFLIREKGKQLAEQGSVLRKSS